MWSGDCNCVGHDAAKQAQPSTVNSNQAGEWAYQTRMEDTLMYQSEELRDSSDFQEDIATPCGSERETGEQEGK